jgi:AcrR family transcriptional regulator
MMSVVVKWARVGGRSERVVAEVLSATLAELGRVGYAGLRIEEVAARAGVAKTTIYRRWPTKPALVEAALRSSRPPSPEPDTGSLAGDLGALAAAMTERMSSPEKRSLARVIHSELDHPEVAAIARALRREAQAPWLAAVRRAAARGELPVSVDPALVVDLVWGPLSARLRLAEEIDPGWLAALIRIVVAGARGVAAL